MKVGEEEVYAVGVGVEVDCVEESGVCGEMWLLGGNENLKKQL